MRLAGFMMLLAFVALGVSAQDAMQPVATPVDLSDRYDVDLDILKELIFYELNTDFAKANTAGDVLYESGDLTLGDSFALLAQYSIYQNNYRFELVDTLDENQVLEIRFNPPLTDQKWELLSWNLPKEWRSKSAKFRVSSQVTITEDHILRISDPLPDNFKIKPSSSFSDMANYGYSVVFGMLQLLIPGLAIMLLLKPKYNIDGHSAEHWIAAVFGSLVVLYLTFFVFLISSIAGLFLVILVYGLSLAICWQGRESIYGYFKQADIRMPLLLWLFAALFSLSAGFLNGGWSYGLEASQARYLSNPLPGDNYLPYLFASKFYHSEPLRPFFMDWLSSDRPPLQAALVLPSRLWAFDPLIAYHAVSVLLQALVLPMVYVLIRGLGQSARHALWVVIAMACSSVFLMNSFYVWPKLIAAAFTMVTLYCLWAPKPKNPELRSYLLGLSVVFAVLSHGGSIIVLPVIFGLALLLGKLPPIRQWLRVIVPVIALYALWLIYQKGIDPPGDRLLKWHIAGHPPPTEESFVSLLTGQYSGLTLQEWFAGKWANIQTLWGNWSISYGFLFPLQYFHEFLLLRSGMFLHFFQSLVPYLAFFILLPIVLLKAPAKLLWAFPIIILGSLVLWVLMIFIPGHTILHQGNYLMLLLSIVWLVWLGAQASAIVTRILLSFNLGFIYLTWILPPLVTNYKNEWLINEPVWDFIALMGIIASALLMLMAIWMPRWLLGADTSD